MKDFKNSTKMVTGHRFAAGGTVGPFARMRPAPGVSGGGDEVNGLTANRSNMEGSSAVRREIPSTAELAEHGGKSPLTPGYTAGGKAEKHFHVHHHYHGGKVSKSKMRKMEMQGEKKATGGTINKVATGGTINKVAKGGKMHKANGGHIQNDTTPTAPDFATGGTINRMNAGGAMYSRGGKMRGG